MSSTSSTVYEGTKRMACRKKHTFCMCVLLCAFMVAASEVQCEIANLAADQISKRCLVALERGTGDLGPYGLIALRGDGEQRNLLLFMGSLMGSGSTPIAVLLETPITCVTVLSADGRDVYADELEGPGYPNIHISTVEGKDEDDVLHTRDVTYFWNGSKYEERDDIGQVCAEALNRQPTLVFLKEVFPIPGADGQESLLLFMGSLTGMNTTRITVFLRTPNACVRVLSAEGRDVFAEVPDGPGYPKINISTDEGKAEGDARHTKDVTYFWNGREYTKRTE